MGSMFRLRMETPTGRANARQRGATLHRTPVPTAPDEERRLRRRTALRLPGEAPALLPRMPGRERTTTVNRRERPTMTECTCQTETEPVPGAPQGPGKVVVVAG